MTDKRDKEIKKVEAHIEKAEADLKIAESAERAAEQELKEAIEELKEVKEHHHEIHFKIQIDRSTYTVHLQTMTGLQLRELPQPPLGSDRDLFEVVPQGSDRKIGNETVVEIRNGLRFFSAPAQINPGRELQILRT